MLLSGCASLDAALEYYTPPAYSVGQRVSDIESTLGSPVREVMLNDGRVSRVYQRWYGQQLYTVLTIDSVVVSISR